MAKTLKKISVILFVAIFTCLLVVGCVILANSGKIVDSGNLDADSGLKTVASYDLSTGNFATNWRNAVTASINSGGANVDVHLRNDWTATSNSNGFGSGTGFGSDGQIKVPAGATITLDLHGEVLNRNLSYAMGDGYAMLVQGTLNLKDSTYTDVLANSLTSQSAIDNAKIGKIKGGKNSNGSWGGCIRVEGTLNMYAGVIYNNQGMHDGGIGIKGGTLNMYGGLIAFNTGTNYAGGIAHQNGTVNIYGGYIRNNTGASGGIASHQSGSVLNIQGGVISNNTANTYGGGVYGTEADSTLKIGAGAQVHSNRMANGTDCNIFLLVNKKITIVDNLSAKSTKVGVTLASGYSGTFTTGYGASNGIINPANYFYSPSSSVKGILSGTEVAMGNVTMIAKPSGTIASKVYNGSTITCGTPSSGYNASTMQMYNNTGTNVATYTAKVQPKSGYIWNDGSLGTALSFNWQITRKPVAKPTVGTNILPYTGKVVTYTPDGYSSSQMTISGNTGTAPNEYTATISPNSNHQWSDGTTTAVTIKWRIGTPIAKPTVGTNSFVYNGSSQTYIPANFNSATMDITGNSGINANTYTASISPKTGYCWNDNTVGAFTLNWSITRKPIDRPTAGTNSFVYNTASQTYQGSGYNSSTMVLGGTSSATNAGTYNITIAPNSNHQWNSGTATETITFPWSITPKPLAKPTLSMTKLEYNSKTLTVPTVGYDSNTMNITGNTGIDAGKKVATITLKDPSNYKWADNTTGPVSLDWEILKKPLEKPTEAVQKTFIYDGTEKTYTPNKIVADGMLLTDNKATEVGTYYAKVNLKPNYQWVGNTEEELSFRFMIVPPGLVVKEGVDYDFIYTDNGTWNQRYTYGDSYQHKMNDQELNQVGGDNVYILGKVQPNTTIAQFLDNIDSDRDFIKIYNNFGELVYDGTANEVASTIQYIGTSYKVELYVTGESGLEILDEVYISILGDLNADGIVNSADMAMMRRLLNGDINLYSLPLERVLAVYLDNKGGLTSVDQELLNGLVAGRITSNELFEEQELLGEEESYKYIDLVDGRRVQASTESAVIGNVTAGTSISEFVDKVAVFLSVGGASNITLYNNVGELVYKGIEGIQAGHSMQEYVGTGWKVKASNSETQYTVSVLGDVTGDGIINAMDVTYLRRIANDNKLLAELEASGNKAVLLAATISNRGGICTADSEILWGTICGTMDLSRYN